MHDHEHDYSKWPVLEHNLGHSMESTRLALQHIIRQLNHQKLQQEIIMSKITDFADQEKLDFQAMSDALDSIATDLVALNQKITDLQNSPGQVTPEDQAALDDIQAKSKAVTAKAQALVVTPPAV